MNSRQHSAEATSNQKKFDFAGTQEAFCGILHGISFVSKKYWLTFRNETNGHGVVFSATAPVVEGIMGLARSKERFLLRFSDTSVSITKPLKHDGTEWVFPIENTPVGARLVF